jgi:hypothetical protein
MNIRLWWNWLCVFTDNVEPPRQQLSVKNNPFNTNQFMLIGTRPTPRPSR